MGARVPFSRNSPAIFQGNNCGLLTNGGLAFKDGTVVHPYAGNPNGVLVLPKGSIVLDRLNAKLYQATDSLGTYAEVGSGGGALTFGRGLTGDGSVGDPLRMSGNYYPAVDAANAFEIRKADGVTNVLAVDTVNTVATLNGKMNLGKVDAFGRTMMWNYGTNSVLKLGSLAQDGDPTDVSSEGVVLVGANSAGTFDATNWAFVRLKSTRLGINNCIANVQQYIFRADETGMYLRNDAGTKTFDVVRSDGTVKLEGNIRPRADRVLSLQNAAGTSSILSVDTANNRIYSNDLYLPALPEDLVTKEYVDTEIAELPFNTKVNVFDSDAEVLFPQRANYAGTVRPVTDQASLVAAIAASVTGDRIEVQNTFTITSTVTINKSILLYAIGGAILETAGAGTDPVTMFSVTAADVCFDSSLYIRHRKTTNTSVECAVNVNALSFISEARVEFMEFGYILRGSFRVSGRMTYTGALGNNHRFIAIYKVSDFSLIDGVVIDFPQEATARASFVLVSSSAGTDVFDSHLCVRNCRQLNMTKYMRQFYMQEAVVSTGDGLASLAFIGNSFNDLNGGFGIFVNRSNLLNFFYSIAVVNNWQGDAGIASYKGLVYIDSPAAPGDLGSTQIYYGGNRHPTNVRVDYTSAYDVGGICYKNTAYSLATAMLSMIQMPDGTEYSSVFRSLYDIPTKENVGSLVGTVAAITLDDADKLAVADVSEANVLKATTMADLKAFLKTYFDTLYGGGGMAVANNTLSGEQSVLPDTEVVLFTYTVPVGKKLTILNGNGSSDGDAVWRIVEDGTTKLKLRNAHQDRNVSLLTPFELVAGAVLTVYGKNVTIEGETNEIGVWLHVSEVNA